MAREVGSGSDNEPFAADIWLCPICQHKNVAVFSCTECGHLRYWRMPTQTTKSSATAGMARSTEMDNRGEPVQYDQLDEGWICTKCGNRNVLHSACAKCGQEKSGQETAGARLPMARPTSGSRKSRDAVHRPASMTLIALYLLIIGALLFGQLGLPPSGGRLLEFMVRWAVVIFFRTPPIIAGIGIWRMRKWGMWFTIILLASWIVFDVVFTLKGVGIGGLGDNTTDFIFRNATRALIIFWLFKNRELFDRHTWTHPDIIQDQLQNDN